MTSGTILPGFDTGKGQILGRVMVVLAWEAWKEAEVHSCSTNGHIYLSPSHPCVSGFGKPLLCPVSSAATPAPGGSEQHFLTHPRRETHHLPSHCRQGLSAPRDHPNGYKTNCPPSTLPWGAPQIWLCQRLSDICGCFAACLFTTETGQQQQGFFCFW